MTNEQFCHLPPIESCESSAQLIGSCHHASLLGYRESQLNIAVQLGNWADIEGTGICFDSSTGFHINELRDRPMRPGIEC